MSEKEPESILCPVCGALVLRNCLGCGWIRIIKKMFCPKCGARYLRQAKPSDFIETCCNHLDDKRELQEEKGGT